MKELGICLCGLETDWSSCNTKLYMYINWTISKTPSYIINGLIKIRFLQCQLLFLTSSRISTLSSTKCRFLMSFPFLADFMPTLAHLFISHLLKTNIICLIAPKKEIYIYELIGLLQHICLSVHTVISDRINNERMFSWGKKSTLLILSPLL